MSLNPSLPDFTSRALAALNARQPVTTAKGQAFFDGGQGAHGFGARLYTVVPYQGLPTRHELPALAVALLRSL